MRNAIFSANYATKLELCENYKHVFVNTLGFINIKFNYLCFSAFNFFCSYLHVVFSLNLCHSFAFNTIPVFIFLSLPSEIFIIRSHIRCRILLYNISCLITFVRRFNLTQLFKISLKFNVQVLVFMNWVYPIHNYVIYYPRKT